MRLCFPFVLSCTALAITSDSVSIYNIVRSQYKLELLLHFPLLLCMYGAYIGPSQRVPLVFFVCWDGILLGGVRRRRHGGNEGKVAAKQWWVQCWPELLWAAPLHLC